MNDATDTTAATPPPAPPPASGWQAPSTATGGPERSTAGLVFGLILLAVGLWFFLERTLGIAMPRIEMRVVWPVILIVIGAVLVVRSAGRRA